MPQRRTLLPLLLALAPLLPACDADGDACRDVQCAPCSPLATIRVVDGATGGPVDGVTVAGGGTDWSCEVAAGETACLGRPPDVVPFDATVTAPGHETEVERVETRLVAGGFCCPDCQAFVPEEVTLQPL